MSTQSPSVQSENSITAYIPGLILIPIGILLAAISLYFGSQQRASQSWPNVAGVVTNAYVEEYRDADQDPSYYARVVYQYEVEGQQYASQQINFGIVRSYASQYQATQALKTYPLGKQVTVYYNPADPGNAVLDRSATRITPFVWLGGGLVLLGAITLLGARRKKVRIG